MPRVKQASKQKRKTKAATVKVLGAAGLGLALASSASASTMPAAGIPQSDNTSPNQRFFLGEEEMADVSLATFHLIDRENFGSGLLNGNFLFAARAKAVANVLGSTERTIKANEENVGPIAARTRFPC